MARGSVQKKGKVWYCVYYYNGRQIWKRAGTSKKDAEKMLNKIVAEIDQGTYIPETKITLKEFVEEKWLPLYAEIYLKPSTLDTYKHNINKHLLPCFSNHQLRHIRAEDIQNLMVEKSESLKPATVLKILNILKRILNHAVKWDYLALNPANKVDSPKQEHKEIDFLNPDEIMLLLNNVDKKYLPMMLLECYSGLRLGELLALTWDDLDFSSNQIRVNKALYNGRVYQPKSQASIRNVDVPKFVMDELFKWQISCLSSDEGILFPNQHGSYLDRHNVRHRALERALIRAGLRKVSFHSLRHSYCAQLISINASPKYISKQLGHSSIRVTFDTYGHLLPITGETSMRLLEEKFGGKKALLDVPSEDFIRSPLENSPNMCRTSSQLEIFQPVSTGKRKVEMSGFEPPTSTLRR